MALGMEESHDEGHGAGGTILPTGDGAQRPRRCCRAIAIRDRDRDCDRDTILSPRYRNRGSNRIATLLAAASVVSPLVRRQRRPPWRGGTALAESSRVRHHGSVIRDGGRVSCRVASVAGCFAISCRHFIVFIISQTSLLCLPRIQRHRKPVLPPQPGLQLQVAMDPRNPKPSHQKEEAGRRRRKEGGRAGGKWDGLETSPRRSVGVPPPYPQ